MQQCVRTHADVYVLEMLTQIARLKQCLGLGGLAFSKKRDGGPLKRDALSCAVHVVQAVPVSMAMPKPSRATLKELKAWSTRSPAVPWWTSDRPLRMATDCSGLCIPEIAADMLRKPDTSVHHVFACDIMPASQAWMSHRDLQPILGDINCRLWKAIDRKIITKLTDGTVFSLTAEAADLDLYVCGFMCTPFTPNGNRKEWTDEHAKTFWSAVKTISVLTPRVFVLENVAAISNNSNSAVVKSALSKLSKYIVIYLKLNTTEFGIPHHRPRVYVVGLLKSAVRPHMSKFSEETLQSFVDKKVREMGRMEERPNFPAWLEALGFPIQKPEGGEEHECTCDVGGVCEAHPCKCLICNKHGEAKKSCAWRKHHKGFLKSAATRKKKMAYLKLWRKVKKDSKLKSPPSYMQLAERCGIPTHMVTSPSRRVLLDTVSKFANLTNPKAVLNLGKSVGRHSYRSDGLVPVLGHGCTSLFFPAFGSYVTVPQLLCLTGLHPEHHAGHFLQAEEDSRDMDIMVGNAMSVPVVGSVIAVALHMVDAQ